MSGTYWKYIFLIILDNVYRGFSFIVCLNTIVTLTLIATFRPHTAGLHQAIVGAIHSTKISGNFGPKLNGSVRSDRKSFEKTGPPFEVDQFSRSDRLEFWLNGSRPVSIYWVELFVPPRLLVIGLSQTLLMVGGFRCKALSALWEEETDPSSIEALCTDKMKHYLFGYLQITINTINFESLTHLQVEKKA